MKRIIHKHWFNFFLALLLVALFWATRLINLGIIPIFTDEAIYLRWSQIMAYDASLRYLPLVDGKPPLFMWVVSGLFKVFKNLDPLLIGRLGSVGSGFFGMLGIAFTSYVLFKNKKVTFLASFLYILVPFTFFYDRFALADSMLTMWGIWSLGLGVLMVRTLRLDLALILGWVFGFGLLTKTPALFFIVLQPLFLVFLDFRSKFWKFNLVKWVGLFVVSVVSSQIIFSVLRLFPLFQMISQKNSEFVVSKSDFLSHPFSSLFSNLSTFVNWEVGYLTIPVFLLVLVSILIGIRKRNLAVGVLSLYSIGCFVVMAGINKVIFPRYLLILTPALIILSAVGLEHLLSNTKLKILALLVLIAVLIQPIYTDYKLLTDPSNAPIPDGDLNQYLNRWPAGYGVIQIHDYLVNESKSQKVMVGTEGTFGLMPYSLEIYQKDYPNLEIKSYWPLSETIPLEIRNSAKVRPTYFIIYQRPDLPYDWKMDLVMKFQQGHGPDYLKFYKVNPNNR